MPKRTDIKSILIIGAGPIVIGQACEFDYSGTQACKALREDGYRIILVNSNPATIMTDPGLADATYVEPITPEVVAKVIERPGDNTNHTFEVLENLVVPEPQDPIAPRREPSVALGVGSGLPSMLPTIDFDDELCLVAYKVGDIRAEGNLAAEPGAADLP